MAGIVRPKNFPIRKILDNQQDHGLIFNQPRFPDHGGFTSAAVFDKVWTGGGHASKPVFNVEPPEKGSKSAEISNRGTQE